MSSGQEVGEIFGAGTGPATALLRSPTVIIASVGLWGMNVYLFRLFGIDYRRVLLLDLVKEEKARAKEKERARTRAKERTRTRTRTRTAKAATTTTRTREKEKTRTRTRSTLAKQFQSVSAGRARESLHSESMEAGKCKGGGRIRRRGVGVGVGVGNSDTDDTTDGNGAAASVASTAAASLMEDALDKLEKRSDAGGHDGDVELVSLLSDVDAGKELLSSASSSESESASSLADDHDHDHGHDHRDVDAVDEEAGVGSAEENEDPQLHAPPSPEPMTIKGRPEILVGQTLSSSSSPSTSPSPLTVATEPLGAIAPTTLTASTVLPPSSHPSLSSPLSPSAMSSSSSSTSSSSPSSSLSSSSSKPTTSAQMSALLESGRPNCDITAFNLLSLSFVLLPTLHLTNYLYIHAYGGSAPGAVLTFYSVVSLSIALPIPRTRWMRVALTTIFKRCAELLRPRCSCLMGTVPRPVPFLDVFFADAMCSLSKVFFDWGMLWHLASHYPDPVPPSLHAIVIPSLCASLPYVIRARQCLVMHEFGKANNDPKRYQHVLNAIKYSTSLFPLVVSAAQKTDVGARHGPMLESLLIALMVVNSVYSFVWDVVMDWGMMDDPRAVLERTLTPCSLDVMTGSAQDEIGGDAPTNSTITTIISSSSSSSGSGSNINNNINNNPDNRVTSLLHRRRIHHHNRPDKRTYHPLSARDPNRDCRRALLRPRLRFGPSASLAVLLADAALRFFWVMRFYESRIFPSNDSYVLCTEFLEMFRRAIWNLLRVEWESIKQGRAAAVAAVAAGERVVLGKKGGERAVAAAAAAAGCGADNGGGDGKNHSTLAELPAIPMPGSDRTNSSIAMPMTTTMTTTSSSSSTYPKAAEGAATATLNLAPTAGISPMRRGLAYS